MENNTHLSLKLYFFFHQTPYFLHFEEGSMLFVMQIACKHSFHVVRSTLTVKYPQYMHIMIIVISLVKTLYLNSSSYVAFDHRIKMSSVLLKGGLMHPQTKSIDPVHSSQSTEAELGQFLLILVIFSHIQEQFSLH